MSESGFWRWWRPQASAGVVCGQGKRQCQCGMPLLPAGMHSHRQFPSCRQQWLVEYHILSTGVRGNAHPPARKQHLRLPGGAAGAMERTLHRECTRALTFENALYVHYIPTFHRTLHRECTRADI